MKCKIECFIAFAFMMGSFFTMTVDKSIFRKFYRNLNDKQRKIYKSIKRDRLGIFLKASFFGVIINGFSFHLRKVFDLSCHKTIFDPS